MSNKRPFFHALAKIQQLQDMFSRRFQVSVSIHDANAHDITIPSNQNAFCYKKGMGPNSLCHDFLLQMQERLTDRLIVTSCPYQCAFAMAPLNCILEDYDSFCSEYFITIVQHNNQSTEDLLASFQSDAFFSSASQSTEFHEIAKLIFFTFDIIFSLMGTEKMIMDIPLPENIKKEKLNTLTAREREILNLVSVGMSNQQIAAQLFISEHTVKAHISNILKKLDLKNRTQLAIFEIQNL